MRTIPQIREDIHKIADYLQSWGDVDLQTKGKQLHDLANETIRRSAVRRASPKHAPLTDDQKMEIRGYAISHPEMHLQDIAVKFNTNSGRVSEAIAGKRE